ncbi:MAG TPA: nitrous oxide reductase family maturation protein NosD [Gemmatimonadales bacterium]|nr:nitrous oxide reductase family maturation protein NosD [Gemmatimonadales bacterium]
MISSLALALLVTDTLRLGPGLHQGPLVLSRPTVVIAAPGAILRGTGTGTVLEIRAAGSVVRGLRIENSGRDPDQYDAGVLVAADSVLLQDLIIRDVLFGVYVTKARGVVMRGLDIAGRAALRESERGDGITFYHSRGIVAAANHIAHVRDGMYFSYSDSITVVGNTVTQVRFGLHYMFSHANRFERNVFTDNATGAVIMFSRGLVVTDNVFAWNTGARSYGLVLQQATDPIVRGNLLVGNGIGVFFDNVIHGTFTDNVIAGNWLGLQLFSNSEATRITGNAVFANTFAATGGADSAAYRLCVDGRGNYWGAAGYDLGGDGVLDVPHAASSPLAELALNREGLRLWLNSPAAQMLAWAERTFPVFALNGATDRCPLAAPPRPVMLTQLPPAPASRSGGHAGQSAAAGLTLLAGLAALLAGRRRR